MKNIKILSNKHIGIIFKPRSGSHVLREFLSSVTNSINLGELFNPAQGTDIDFLENKNSFLVGNRKFIWSDLNNEIANLKNTDNDDTENLKTLELEASLNNYFVFSINPIPYKIYRENLFKKLKKSENIQYIRLERLDVLSYILSIYFAQSSKIWHRTNPNENIYKPKTTKISLDWIIERLNINLETDKDINKYYPDLSTIYYEQFQNNIHNLRNLVDGVPKKIVSNPYIKIGIDYKEYVENINEIEDYYEQFVNDNKKYFPQYFGKLPHITIPSSQGRQPRDLSQLQLAVGV